MVSQNYITKIKENKMACFLYSGYDAPYYLTLIVDREKIKSAATETLEEYLVTNRFGLAPDRIDIYSPISYSINNGYKANIECLYYNFDTAAKRKFKVATKDALLKYDFLGTAGLDIPVVKESIAEMNKKHCGEKIQIIDVVIALKNGEEITDYKAINVINRVEAFTWEGSEKDMYYEENSAEFKEYLDKGLDWVPKETRFRLEKEKKACFKKYGYPQGSMKTIAYKKEVIDKEIICKDSITEVNLILIGDQFASELKKHKFKGLVLLNTFDTYKFV